MSKFILFILVITPYLIFSQRYSFKLTSKLMGDDVLKYGSEIIVDATNKTIEYTTAPNYVYTDGLTFNLDISGFAFSGDQLIANFNIDNPAYYGTEGKLQANFSNNRLQFVDWSMEGRGNSAVYTFEFHELYDVGDMIILSGEFEVLSASKWPELIGLAKGTIMKFNSVDNSVSYINNKGRPAVWYFKTVQTHNNSSTGIITGENGYKLGSFEMSQNSFQFMLMEKGEVTLTRSKWQLEQDRIIQEQEREKTLAEEKVKEKIQNVDYLGAIQYYVEKRCNNSQLATELQSIAKITTIKTSPMESEIIDIIRNNSVLDSLINGTNKSRLSPGKFKLISDPKTGIYFLDLNTKSKIELSRNPAKTNIGNFQINQEFSYDITVEIKSEMVGIALNNQWKGKLQSGDLTMRFFYVEKKGEKLIIGGVKEVPPSKYLVKQKIPFFKDLSNVKYYSDIELKETIPITKNELIINNVVLGSMNLFARERLPIKWYY